MSITSRDSRVVPMDVDVDIRWDGEQHNVSESKRKTMMDENDNHENNKVSFDGFLWYIPSGDNHNVKEKKKIFWKDYIKPNIVSMPTSDDYKEIFSTDEKKEGLNLNHGEDNIKYGSKPIPDIDTLREKFIEIYEPKKTYSSNIGINHLRNMSVSWYFDKIHDFRDTKRYFKKDTTYLNVDNAKVKKHLHRKSIIACLCNAFSKPYDILKKWKNIKKFEALIIKTIFHSIYKRYLNPFYEEPHYRIIREGDGEKTVFEKDGYKQIPIVTIEEKDGKKVFVETGDWGSGVRAATTFHHEMMDGLNPDKKRKADWLESYKSEGKEINKNLHLRCKLNEEKKYTDEPKTQEPDKPDGNYYYDYNNIKLRQEKPIDPEPVTNSNGKYKIIIDNRSPGSLSIINDGVNEYYNGSWRFLTNRTDAASSSTVSGSSVGNILNPKDGETLSVIVPFIINGVVGEKASKVEKDFNQQADKKEKVKFIKENAGKLFQEKPIAYYLRIDKKRSIGKSGNIPEDYELKFTFVQPGIANDSKPGSQKIETVKWVPIRANTGNEIGWTLGGDDRMPNDLAILASFISLLVMDKSADDNEFERFIRSFHYMYDDAGTKASMEKFIEELIEGGTDTSATNKFDKLKEVFVQLMTLGRKSIGYTTGEKLDEPQKQYLITFVISALVHLKTLGDYLLLPEAFALNFFTDNQGKTIVIYTNDGFLKFGQGVFFNCDELIYSIDDKDYTGKHLKKILNINDEISFVDPTEKWKKFNKDTVAKRRRLTVRRTQPGGQSGGGKKMYEDVRKVLKNPGLMDEEEEEEFKLDEIFERLWEINRVAMRLEEERKKVSKIPDKPGIFSTEEKIKRLTKKVGEFSEAENEKLAGIEIIQQLQYLKKKRSKEEREKEEKASKLSMTSNEIFETLIGQAWEEEIKKTNIQTRILKIKEEDFRKGVENNFWRIIITENEKVTMATWWYILKTTTGTPGGEEELEEGEKELLKEISEDSYKTFQMFCLKYMWARFENCKEPVAVGDCSCLPTIRIQTKEIKQEMLNKMRNGIMLRVSKMNEDQLKKLEDIKEKFEDNSLFIDKHGNINEDDEDKRGGDLMAWWGWALSCRCCKCMPQPKCCSIQGGKKTTKKRRRKKKKTRKRRRKKKRTKKKRRRRRKKTRGKR